MVRPLPFTRAALVCLLLFAGLPATAQLRMKSGSVKGRAGQTLTPVRCGESWNGSTLTETDHSECSGGANYAYLAAPSSPTNPACAVNTSISGNNQLAGNCDVGAGNIAYTIGAANTVLDLNGYTLTGRIVCTAFCSGLKIITSRAGGKIVALWNDSGANAGAFRVDHDANQTAPIIVDGVEIDNASDPGTGGVRAIYIAKYKNAATPRTYSGSSPQVQIRGVKITSHTATTSARAYLVYMEGLDRDSEWGYGVVTQSDLTCAADTSACQVAAFYGSKGFAVSNKITLQQNTTAQSGRGPLFDAEGTTAGSADGGSMSLNTITVNNNRCGRVRKARNISITHNRFKMIKGACLHLGDATDKTDLTNANLRASENAFEFAAGGIGVEARNIDDAVIKDNPVSCTAGQDCSTAKFAYARTAVTPPGTTSVVTLCNNSGIAGAGLAASTVETGAEIKHISSGSVSGAGQSTPIGSCPSP